MTTGASSSNRASSFTHSAKSCARRMWFTDPRGQFFAAKGAPDHPRFQRSEAAAELDAVVHVVDVGADGIAAQIFRHGGKSRAQPSDVAHGAPDDSEGADRIDHAPARPPIFHRSASRGQFLS